jgi:tRNA nucleotidyltransferase (CCA-adding enzyme)
LKKPIEIRIAGGWVRDKILKHESQDVDIALDSMSGLQFAYIVQQYILHQNNTHGEKLPGIGVIAANPDQSKHLETATMKVVGIECDFVHLRGGEVYASNSRIPTLKEDATPLDDALRRDFTVNSLFYNLRLRQVEDWTGRGISDLLHSKLLVTPLDASITFHDDPLRVLRAIRFAVRYNLTLSDEIVNAAKSPEVHQSLHVKISRERIGKELEGMLTGKNARPCIALKYITDLKLAGCVFEFPHDEAFTVHGTLYGVDYGNCEDPVLLANAREMAWLESTAVVRCTTMVLESFHNFFSQYDGEKTGLNSRILYLATFLHPLRKMVVSDPKGKQQSLPSFIVRESIKFKNKDIQAVTAILSNVDEMRNVLMRNKTNDDFCRLQVGLVLRNLKEQWVTTLLVAAIAEIQSREEDTEHVQHIITRTKHLYSTIQTNGLDGCWRVRPLLDGKDILQRLDLPRGPAIAPYIDAQIRWMLLNPKGHKEELIVHLKRKRDLESSENTALKIQEK